ncbi:HU family DNA-binding protein [Flavobacterium luteum]|nr:HU family DNA-binding protein [Flavobacterium luteum]
MLYYPRATLSGEIDLDTLAEEVSLKCTATPADCYAVIISLVHVVSNALKDGNIVRLGAMGSFQVSVKGTASNSPEALNQNNIKSASIFFRPGAKFKKMLGELVFYKKKI